MKELLTKYNKNNNKPNYEIVFFIKYHLCRLYFINGNYENANKYLKELLLFNREKYVLGLPIKYMDHSDEPNTILYIIELLMEKKLDDYFYAYILNWLRKSNYKDIFGKLDKYYKYENNKYIILNYKKIKEIIILNFINDKKLNKLIKHGKIVNITRNKNAFVSDGTINIFTDKKYISKNTKKGASVRYFVVEKYNIIKKDKIAQAIIINGGGNYEILCGKKRK